MLQAFPSSRISVHSIPVPDAEQAAGQESLHVCYCPSYQEGLCQKYYFSKWMKLCFWRRCLLGILPTVSLTITAIVLVLHYSLSPAFSFIYIGGSVEIPYLTYTNDLNDPTSQKFILQTNTIQNYLAETYESSFLGKYYLKSVVAAFTWCGPGAWTPSVVHLTSSSNVILLTFSLDQRGESNVLKAHFQAVPKIICGGQYISWNGTLSSPYYPSYYPPNIDFTWIIKASFPGYKLSIKILIIQIQEKSPGSSKCDKD